MEQLKELKEVFKPDSRMDAFSTSLEWDHRKLSEIALAQNVPEDVGNYFETIKNICLYARFVYAFYAVAEFLTYPLLELALRKRLRPSKEQRSVSFRKLLVEAIKLRLIKEERFSHIRRMQEESEMLENALRESGLPVPAPVPANSYVKILAKTLPSLRNQFAHPKYLPIQVPGGAFFAIRFAAEFINQLYER